MGLFWVGFGVVLGWFWDGFGGPYKELIKIFLNKNSFLAIFWVKFHPTASLGTVLHAEFQKEAIAHGPDTVAPQVS